MNRAFYDGNAATYVANTGSLDLGFAWQRFLAALPFRGMILDAGCGSGRDAAHFVQQGYLVDAIDASLEMVAATERRGVNAEQRLLQDVDKIGTYAGIWACASLLHVPKSEIELVLGNFARALVLGGVAYVSLKEGVGEGREQDGRYFSYFTEETFAAEVAKIDGLRVRSCERTGDAARRSQVWLNFLIERVVSVA